MTSPYKILSEWNIKPKKQLGQNFLSDPSTSLMIIEKSELTKEDTVFEIGAGLGGMTLPLSSAVKKVYAIEKDESLLAFLNAELDKHSASNVQIINENILYFDMRSFFENRTKKINVIGNLPYGISSQIIVKLINERDIIKKAIVMLQKELAERLLAAPNSKDYGRLTVMLNYCADISKIANVKAHLFCPEPKVDSTIIKIDFSKKIEHTVEDESFFFSVIKAAFGQRRKNLKNALSGSGLGIKVDVCLDVLKKVEIDGRRRAESLNVEEFTKLSNELFFNLKKEKQHERKN